MFYTFTPMEKINYPLLCFNLGQDAVLGILVGTDYEAVEANPRKLKTVLVSHLQKKYKKDGDYPLFQMNEPQLKMIEFSLRPTVRTGLAAFPLSGKVTLSIPLVYGESEPGVHVCYLPLLDDIFYCYDLQQLEMLARYFIHNSLDQESPEEIYRIANYPEPVMEIVSIRVGKSNRTNFSWNFRRKPEVLESLAERYPYPKAVQRNLGAQPDAAWELEAHVASVTEKLFQQRASVLITGEPGVGKSAVLRQVIRKMAALSRKTEAENSFWRIQAQRFTSTSKYLGQWQEIVEELVWELNTVNGILWIENIVRLLREGGKGVEDSVAAYLLPFIQDGKLQIVGEVTPQELESIRRLLPGLVESVQLVEIRELPEKSLHVVFEKFTSYLLQQYKVSITRDALSTALRLLKRFYPYESFPGKGIRFLGECVSDALFHKHTEVGRKEVVSHFIRRTGLPELFLRDDLLLDQEELKSFFTSQIIGQTDAIDKLCDIVKVFKAGLNNPHKPITTLIFAGPTGVGKTASAQALARYFFGKGQKQTPLIRIDMSEFQYPGQITRFLGAGGEPGKLVSDVRERPFAVLLLDEAEKASPAIFDAFLTVLDEGMLVDAFGRVTNFRNCIIILTTNLGASNRAVIGYGNKTAGDETFQSAIGNHFRPEFVNRIDSVVVFQPLNQEHIRAIALKELEEAKHREGFEKNGIGLVFSERVLEYLAGIGFHEKYGARPLQRALEDHILKPIANWMLENPKVRNCKVEVDFTDELVIRKGGGE